MFSGGSVPTGDHLLGTFGVPPVEGRPLVLVAAISQEKTPSRSLRPAGD